jgi:Putative zinc-finger
MSPKPNRADPCGKHSIRILQYLENGLSRRERQDFLAHLMACPDCSARLEEEALSLLLRQSQPLFKAPAELRARVSAAIVPHSATNQPQNGFAAFWKFSRGRCGAREPKAERRVAWKTRET